MEDASRSSPARHLNLVRDLADSPSDGIRPLPFREQFVGAEVPGLAHPPGVHVHVRDGRTTPSVFAGHPEGCLVLSPGVSSDELEYRARRRRRSQNS